MRRLGTGVGDYRIREEVPCEPSARARRIVALAAAASVVATITAGGSSGLAADTRQIYFGSPPADLSSCTGAGFCPLTFTPLTTGGNQRTATDVVISNLGNQTVNHVLVPGGVLADQAEKNPNFPPPAPPSLPSPLSFADVFPAGICAISSVSTADDSLSCPIGTLAAGASVSFRIVIDAPSGATAYGVWLMVAVNESSSSGTNQDVFHAVGTIIVAAPTCLVTANYFLPAEAVGLATPVAAGCTQPTSITGPTFPVRGAFASVGTTSSSWCPAGLTCLGLLSVSNVNSGEGGPVTWTITWPSKPKGVIHFLDGYDPSTNPTAFERLAFKNSTRCPNPTPATALCWHTLTTSGGFTTGVFQTPENGGIKGTKIFP